MQRFGGLVNLNMHFHLVVPDGVFVDDDDRLAFALHPVPISADVLAILDRVVRRIARWLAFRKWLRVLPHDSPPTIGTSAFATSSG